MARACGRWPRWPCPPALLRLPLPMYGAWEFGDLSGLEKPRECRDKLARLARHQLPLLPRCT
eukprot:scaffold40042_cov35-Tisochrysis_lutea.AAC.1